MKILILDAGHGGSDSGAVGNALKEKDINLQMVKYIKAYLDTNYQDIKVILTRSTDVFVELVDRAKVANNAKADFFMSCHVNSSTNASGNGWETFTYTKASQASKNYQKKIHETVMKQAPFFKDRGMQSANLSVLRNTVCPSILTESGFISNVNDSNVLKDLNKIQALAIAHALGVASALGLVLKPSTPTTTYKVGKSFDNRTEAQTYLNSIEKDGNKGFSIYTDK